MEVRVKGMKGVLGIASARSESLPENRQVGAG